MCVRGRINVRGGLPSDAQRPLEEVASQALARLGARPLRLALRVTDEALAFRRSFGDDTEALSLGVARRALPDGRRGPVGIFALFARHLDVGTGHVAPA